MQSPTLFPVGSHICRQPAPPMAELKRDMETLRRNHFNLIKIQTHWMLDEPVEGRVDMSFTEELVAHAARLGMGVYIGFTCEQAPHWVYEKYPDSRPILRDGRATPYEAASTLPADGKPGPCFDHPGVRADQLRYIRAQVAALAKHGNITVWNMWQEIGYWSGGLLGQDSCFCPHTLAYFHEWLRGKYHDLATLNRAWRANYPAWESIQPDRLRTPQPSVQDAEWRFFMDNIQIARVLRERAAATREADPLKRPVFAHKAGPDIGAAQDWTYARESGLEFLGSSSYPAWGCLHDWDDNGKRPYPRDAALLNEMWDKVAFRFDYIRCANPPGAPVWAAEFQGGPASIGLHRGRVPSAGDIRRWMFSALGSGVTAISFWVTRLEVMALENNGFGLLDGEGDETERLSEAGRIARALASEPALFAQPTLPRAQAAILVNELNSQYASTLRDADGHLAYDIRGWYKRFWDDGIPVDFVTCGELDKDHARSIKLLIVPFMVVLSDAEVAQLAAFAERGAQVVFEAMSGRLDEYGYCPRPGMSPTLSALLGIRHESLLLVREPDGATRWSLNEWSWGEYLDPLFLTGEGPLAGCRLRANFYVETVQFKNGGRVSSRAGEQDAPATLRTPDRRIAGVCKTLGKGSIWWLGTFVGHGGTAHRDPESGACFRALCKAAGVASDACGCLLRRRRVLPEKQAWIFTNPSGETATERVPLENFTSARDLLGGPLVLENGHAVVSVPPLDARIVVVE